MEKRERTLRRLQLDEQLVAFGQAVPPAPAQGWVKAVREALGLTLEALGKRMGVGKESVRQLESAEVAGTVTLNRLRSAAEAMDCALVVTLVPRSSLQQTLLDRARSVARQQMRRVQHSMVMEDQAVYGDDLDKLIELHAQELIDRNDPRLWK